MIVAVIGASAQTDRYSYQAVELLLSQGYQVVPITAVEQDILGLSGVTKLTPEQHVETISLYLRPSRWSALIEDIMASGARRVICNPGTESPEHAAQLEQAGIRVIEACTLVLLRTGQFDQA